MADEKELTLILKARNLASREVNKLHGALDKVGDATRRAGRAALAFGKILAGLAVVGILGVVAGLIKAVDKASDLNESMSKVTVVFRKSATGLVAWSKTTAKSLGISQQKALEALGTFGNLFRAMRIGLKPAANMSKRLVTLAADLASFNNANPEDVLLALRAGLVGEAEPLRRFGINLNDARLRLEAVRLGLIKTVKEGLTPAAKAQAAYSLIMKDSALAQGDFARTSGGLANQQRIAAAVIDDSMAKIGTAILPIVTKVLPPLVEGIAKVATWINDKLIPAVSRWYEQNKPLITQIRDTVVNVVTTLWNTISTVVTWIGNLVTSITSNKAAMDVLRTFAQRVGELFDLAWKALSKFVDLVGRLGKKISENKDAMTFLNVVLGSIVGYINDIIAKGKAALSFIIALIDAGRKLAGGYGGDIPSVNHPHPGLYPPTASGGWVGMHGPEVRSLGEAGPEYVVPNHQLGALGSQTIVLNIDGQTIAEVIVPKVSRSLYYELQRSAPTLSRT